VESVKLAGGTLVTPYGAHSAAHAAGACASGVVVVTEAQAPAAALGRGAAETVGVAIRVGVGAGLPHEDISATARIARTPRRMPSLSTVP
jgi:hypothetical protein